MEEILEIYEFQAKLIANALRLAANILKSRNKITSADRDIMQAIGMIQNVLAKDIDKQVKR